MQADKMDNLTDITPTLIENVELVDLKAFIEHLGEDQDKMDQLLKNEVMLGAFLNLQLLDGRSEYVIQILQNMPTTIKNQDFPRLWDEAHYRKYGNANAPLSPLQKFRIRKRNPPPHNICPDGHHGRNVTKTKEARAILTTWLEEHKNNPYPTKEAKRELSERAGLSYSQVNNWFANARRTIRKRMRSNRSISQEKKVKQEVAATITRQESAGATKQEVQPIEVPLVIAVDQTGDGKQVTGLTNDLLPIKKEEQFVEPCDCKVESRYASIFHDIESNLQNSISSTKLEGDAFLNENRFYSSTLKPWFGDAIKVEIPNKDTNRSSNRLVDMLQTTRNHGVEVGGQVIAANRETMDCSSTQSSSDTTSASSGYQPFSSSVTLSTGREPLIHEVLSRTIFKEEQQLSQNYSSQRVQFVAPMRQVMQQKYGCDRMSQDLKQLLNNGPTSVTSSNIRERKSPDLRALVNNCPASITSSNIQERKSPDLRALVNNCPASITSSNIRERKSPASRGCGVQWYYCQTCHAFVSELDPTRTEHYRAIDTGHQRIPFANKVSDTNAKQQHENIVKMLCNGVKDESNCFKTSGMCLEKAKRQGNISNRKKVGKENTSCAGDIGNGQCTTQMELSENNCISPKKIHVKQSSSASRNRNKKKKSATKPKIFFIDKKDTNGTSISNMKFIKDLRLKIQAKKRDQQSTASLMDLGDDTMSSIKNLQNLCDSVGKEMLSQCYTTSIDAKAVLDEDSQGEVLCENEADLDDAWATETSETNASECRVAALFANAFSSSNSDSPLQQISDGVQSSLMETAFLGQTERCQPSSLSFCSKSLVGHSGPSSKLDSKLEPDEFKNPDYIQDWMKNDQPMNLSMEACSSLPICGGVGELGQNSSWRQHNSISSTIQSGQYSQAPLLRSYSPLETIQQDYSSVGLIQQSYSPLGTVQQSCTPVETMQHSYSPVRTMSFISGEIITSPRVEVVYAGQGDSSGYLGDITARETAATLYSLPDSTAENEFGTVLGEAVQGLLTLSSQESTSMD